MIRRWASKLSVVGLLVAWLGVGLAAPIIISLYSPDIAVDTLEAAPSDAYVLPDPVVISETPFVRIERGTLAVVDGQGRPVAQALT